MKKVLLVAMVLIVFALNGCSNKNLENVWFSNSKTNTMEEAETLYFEYYDTILAYDDSTYNKTKQYFYNDEDYIAHEEYLYALTKEDFLNYQISDDKYRMDFYDSLYPIVNGYKQVYNFINFGDVAEEGVVHLNYDYDNQADEEFLFYMEDDKLLIKETDVSKNYTYEVELFFYKNDGNKLVCESLVKKAVIGAENVYEWIKTVYVEDDYVETYRASNLNMDEASVTGSIVYTYYDMVSEDIFEYRFTKTDQDEIKTYLFFDGFEEEYYSLYESPTNSNFDYMKFDGNIMLIAINDLAFELNLIPIEGWDEAREINGPKYYSLYLEDEIISNDFVVEREWSSGDYLSYKYISYDAETDTFIPWDDSDISLSKYGLDSGYSEEFYSQKKTTFISSISNLLEDYDMDDTFDELYDSFLYEFGFRVVTT